MSRFSQKVLWSFVLAGFTVGILIVWQLTLEAEVGKILHYEMTEDPEKNCTPVTYAHAFEQLQWISQHSNKNVRFYNHAYL